MTARIAFVCEAEGDFADGSQLVDSVIEAHRPDYLAGYEIDHLRAYCGFELSQPFLRWKHINMSAEKHGTRLIRGQFGDFFPDDPAAIEVLRAVRLFQFYAEPTPAAIVFLKDSDNKAERRKGLQETHNALSTHAFPVIVGVAHTERECWLIAGFVPQNNDEVKTLDEITRRLTLDPCTQSHRLAAPNEGDDRHPKNVLQKLTGANPTRQAICLQTVHEQSQHRGAHNGLTDFLDALRTRLIHRLFGGPPPEAQAK